VSAFLELRILNQTSWYELSKLEENRLFHEYQINQEPVLLDAIASKLERIKNGI
jgi:hypothetical protein